MVAVWYNVTYAVELTAIILGLEKGNERQSVDSLFSWRHAVIYVRFGINVNKPIMPTVVLCAVLCKKQTIETKAKTISYDIHVLCL